MEKLLIGKVQKAQGLSGELKCSVGVDFNSIKDITEIFLNNKDVPTKIIKKDYRLGSLFLTLSRIDCREKADLLRGSNIYIDKKFYKETKSDVYLIEDLIDCSVVSCNGEDFGKIIRTENYGASDILIIFADMREYMIPFVKDIFKKVCVQSKLVVVDKKKFLENRMCE